MCSTGRSISSEAAMKVSTATTRPRVKPPSENAVSSSSGEAGEESWSWIAPWNFCWRIDDALFENEFIAQAIMISPGTTKITYLNPWRVSIRVPSAAPKTEM